MLSYLYKSVSQLFSPEDDKNEKETGGIKEEKENIKHFCGTITSLHHGYGLIDQETYFSLSMVRGIQPEVGMAVHVEAHRKHETGGWRAVAVSAAADYKDNDAFWDGSSVDPVLATAISTDTGQTHSKKTAPSISQFTQEPEQELDTGCTTDQDLGKIEDAEEPMVGRVTNVSRDSGNINDHIYFDLNDTETGYKPYQGDWVTAVLVRESGGTYAKDVRPLREQMFQGQVSSAAKHRGHGYIDREIFFYFEACVNGQIPRAGDHVTGRAIESNQRGNCSWRAITVECVYLDSRNRHARPLRQPSPLKNEYLKELCADKCGVTITDTLDFGKMFPGEQKTVTAWIRYEGRESVIYRGCQLQNTSRAQIQVSETKVLHECVSRSNHKTGAVFPGQCVELSFGLTLCIKLTCQASNIGLERNLLVFEFAGFKIARYTQVNVLDQSGRNRWGPGQNVKEPFDPSSQWLIPGVKPTRTTPKLNLPNRLPQYKIPDVLRDCVYERGDLLNDCPVLSEPLTSRNYSQRFSALLHLEETQMEIDIRQFDLDRVCMRPVGQYLGLKVPGLAEGRPSVLVGDSVLLSEPGDDDDSGPLWEGCVHEVLHDEVLLKFTSDFHHHYTGQDYNVMFTFNRTPLRRAHQAVHFVPSLGQDVLFPTKLVPKMSQHKFRPTNASLQSTSARPVSHEKSLGKHQTHCGSGTLTFFNQLLNTRQREAVVRIVEGQSRPVPYVLFGPPGTGKTVTLVEAILQVFQLLPSSRILVCAPSNSASDLLAQRLHESGQVKLSDMVRLNAFQRQEESLPECIRPYCQNGDNLELLSRHRIIVSTSSSAGMLYSLNLKQGHFTHAFIDEAGQSTEAECMIPVGLAAGGDGQVTLAGDPQQLGPVLQSNLAKDHGLMMSYLERLMDRQLYGRDEAQFRDQGCYNPLLVTKLTENYRSHPVLLDLPSRLFYHNELSVAADKELINSFVNWTQLPNQDNCPLIFHGVKGEDMREGNSPSWFNPAETVEVMKYLQALLNDETQPLTPDSISVITPYRKQVEKIRLLMGSFGVEGVKVGSVEEFQGQERRAIIISTVRARESLRGFDTKHNLGFLSNPKRFNVAITRAQALLIVIGNPYVLAQDSYWLELIKYCVEKGAYTGCSVDELLAAQVAAPIITQEEAESPGWEGTTTSVINTSGAGASSDSLEISSCSSSSQDSMLDNSSCPDTALNGAASPQPAGQGMIHKNIMHADKENPYKSAQVQRLMQLTKDTSVFDVHQSVETTHLSSNSISKAGGLPYKSGDTKTQSESGTSLTSQDMPDKVKALFMQAEQNMSGHHMSQDPEPKELPVGSPTGPPRLNFFKSLTSQSATVSTDCLKHRELSCDRPTGTQRHGGSGFTNFDHKAAGASQSLQRLEDGHIQDSTNANGTVSQAVVFKEAVEGFKVKDSVTGAFHQYCDNYEDGDDECDHGLGLDQTDSDVIIESESDSEENWG